MTRCEIEQLCGLKRSAVPAAKIAIICETLGVDNIYTTPVRPADQTIYQLYSRPEAGGGRVLSALRILY